MADGVSLDGLLLCYVEMHYVEFVELFTVHSAMIYAAKQQGPAGYECM